MTPKEKAKELLDRYNHIVNGYVVIDNNTFEHLKNIGYDKAKKCALIAVEEIVQNDYYRTANNRLICDLRYWQEVKQEIENL
jgi:hypothetical protein